MYVCLMQVGGKIVEKKRTEGESNREKGTEGESA